MRNTADLTQQIDTALEYMGDNGEDLDHHYSWMLCELVDRLGPDDLTPEEKVAMVAILVPAHARKLAAVGDEGDILLRRHLRVVPPLGALTKTTANPAAN